jgi:hypothetical protein
MQTREDFLQKHKNADMIVTTTDGDLVRAEYLRIDGRLRETPAVYYYPEY